MNRVVGGMRVYHVELAEAVDGLDRSYVCEGIFFGLSNWKNCDLWRWEDLERKGFGLEELGRGIGSEIKLEIPVSHLTPDVK